MVRQVIQSFPGFTIDDVLNTDIDDLYGVLGENPKQEDKVVDLLDFVKHRQEGGK